MPRARGLSAWLRVWWVRVPEPRSLSLGWGSAYAVLCLTALFVLVIPPSGSQSPGELAARALLGGLNVAGTLLAMVSGYFDFWKGERLGLAGLAAGSILFAFLTVTTSPAVLHLEAFAIGYALFALVVLAIRFLMIRWYTFRPRG